MTTATAPAPSAADVAMFGTYFSIDNCKSYATKENLIKALEKVGCTRDHRPLAVKNSEGRWTAIIPASACEGNMTAFPGFMKFG